MTNALRGRVPAGLTALATLVALLVVLPPAAADAQVTADGGLATPQVAAAAFIADELAATGNDFGGSLGLTADAVLGLTAVGVAGDVASDATDALEAGVNDFVAPGGVVDAGRAAKLVLVADALGRDPTAFGRRSLRDDLVDNVGVGGEIGQSTFAQALGVTALAVLVAGDGTDTDAEVALDLATDELLALQCDDGGISGSRTDCTSDADVTALGIQAFRATGEDVAAADAADYLVANQLASGAIDYAFGANSNTTGLAAWALRSLDGYESEADAAADWVTARQLDCSVPVADRGAIAYNDEAFAAASGGISDGARGQFRFATTQAMLAWSDRGYHELDATTAAAGTPSSCWDDGVCPDDTGVTSIVETTSLTDGAPMARCADWFAGMDGLDLLRAAGFTPGTQEFGFGPALCTIEDLPEDANDSCFGSATDPGGYWSYWLGDQASTSWESAQVGPADISPQPGDLQAFAWAKTFPADEPSTRLPAQPPVEAERLSGANRVETAIAISQASYPTDGSAGGVVLTRKDAFADALAGAPAAAQVGGPMLLTATDRLEPSVLAEVERVLPVGGTVHLLGGTAALSQDVADDLTDAGYEIDRLAGNDRYATAVEVATFLDDPDLQVVTTGLDFPDALSAAAVAVDEGGAVLLSRGSRPASSLDTYLAANPGDVVAIGGPAATAYSSADAVVGSNRYETAALVAQRWFADADAVALARGDSFPDAMVGGVFAGSIGAPILLTRTESLSSAAADRLCTVGFHTGRAVLFGGESAISTDVAAAVKGRLAGSGC